jgi:FkbH-like protein
MSKLDQPVSREDVEAVFQALLNRPVGDEGWTERVVAQGVTLGHLLASVRCAPELGAQILAEAGAEVPPPGRLDDHRFRLPGQLAVAPGRPPRVLLIGSCLMNPWNRVIQESEPGAEITRIVFNNAAALPPLTGEEARGYDFQVIQLALRSFLKEAAFFSLPAEDHAAYQALFEACCATMRRNLRAALAYHRDYGIPAYVLNFCVPMQNPLGRAQDRYSLNNMVYFIEQLNRCLHEEAAGHPNLRVIDLDAIAATYGRKHFQEDHLLHVNHGGLTTSIAARADAARLEPVGDIQALYEPRIERVVLAAWREILAHRKAELGTEQVKLVIFDLDDTLWRGVAAEVEEPGPEMVEGWPMGILEAASYLWRRGVLLAIASKNDEAVARRIWDRLYGTRFGLENFVSVKINWRPKAENVAAILRETNLLAESVLFVDDNPVERAAMREAFPGIRVMDAPLAEWRRILLWAPELQRATITAEAAARTAMVQAGMAREEARQGMDQEAFLASLGIRVVPHRIAGTGDARFPRCFELLNKTNQFNTTGRRWTLPEMEALFAEGGSVVALEVSDRFTHYGITGLSVLRGDTVEQFVLSCRVFGMGIEQAAMAIAQGHVAGPLRGLIRPTERNRLSLGLYEGLGFRQGADGAWLQPDQPLPLPPHIRLAAA